jgi:hypothetical protein
MVFRETRRSIQPEPAPNDAQESSEPTEVKHDMARLRRDGDVILGKSGYSVQIVEGSTQIKTMAFGHEEKVVYINPDFLRTLSEEEGRYVFGHEIGHFSQFAEDPDLYVGTFEKAEKRSRQHPDAVQSHVQKAWNRFYNAVLDVHTNVRVEERSPWVQKKEGTENPRVSLYSKISQPDMREAPRCEQFSWSILRACMLPNGDPTQVGDDVSAVLNVPVKYLGRTYPTLIDFVQQKFKKDQPIGRFLRIVERALVPLFTSLIDADVADGQIQNQEMVFDLSGEDMDADEAKEMKEGMKEGEKTASEQAADRSKAKSDAELRESGFTNEQRARINEIVENTTETFTKIADFWKVVQQKITEWEEVNQAGFRSGQVNVAEAVRQWPTLMTDPSNARIFDRKESLEKRTELRPTAIDLRLVVDLSGSMGDEERKAMQELLYCITQSLFLHERRQNAGQEEKALRINLEIDGFGDASEELFDRTPKEKADRSIDTRSPRGLRHKLYRALIAMQEKNLGGTVDGPVLERHAESVSAASREADTAAMRTTIVVEITDGASDTAEQSRTAVEALNAAPDTYAVALLLSETGSNDTFEFVWGEHGQHVAKTADLPDALMKVLFSAIQKNL